MGIIAFMQFVRVTRTSRLVDYRLLVTKVNPTSMPGTKVTNLDFWELKLLATP